MPASTARAVISPWAARSLEGFVQASSRPKGNLIAAFWRLSWRRCFYRCQQCGRDDDTIIKRNARRQLDVAAEITGDRHRLEQHLVAGADGGKPPTVLVAGVGGHQHRRPLP